MMLNLTIYKEEKEKKMYITYFVGACEMMQPIAAGYDLDTSKFPRVQDWMERVKKETQPHFDDAHAIARRMREKILQDEKRKID